MCGIVGYIGDRDITSVLLVGLERLSYRGYDSSGIAILSNGELSYWKKPGKIHALEETLKNFTIHGELGIGHTRWATHGEPNEMNAHPQISQNEKIAVVHNGIIENHTYLRKDLIRKGYIFRSKTDTEVISHLIDYYLEGDLEQAVIKATRDLVGAYALAAIAEQDPEKIIVARRGSPIILGLGKNENFVSSDINAIIHHTKNIIYLDNDEIATISKKKIIIKNLSGEEIKKEIHTISWDATASEKQGYEYYMHKEIHEQPNIVRNIIQKTITSDNRINFKHLKFSSQNLNQVNRFIIQACGTSYHAGLIGKYLLESYTRILTEVDISSEFRYRQMIGEGKEIVVALSQSGETADTLAAIREAKAKFFKILSFVNVKGSSIDRESDSVIYTHAGQEIGVASTKNFLAQVICLYIFMLHLAQIKYTLDNEQALHMIQNLKLIPDYIEKILNQEEKIKKIAKKYYKSREFIFIGRGINYPSALEGALKLKEISYIHATGYPAGELKHGPIALIDSNLPVVCIAPKSSTYDKMRSNIQEVKARHGKTIIIATQGDQEITEYADDIIYIPEVEEELSPILVAIPMQLLAYHIALLLGCDVDQPRNLAKSVTVE